MSRPRRLTQHQLRETIRAEARRIMHEDAEGGGLRVRDVLAQVEDDLRQASTKTSTVARALTAAQDSNVAARQIAQELAACLQGLKVAIEKIGRARSRAGG